MKEKKKLWEEVRDDINAVVHRRKRVLNPFRLDPKLHLYQFALTQQEWAAFRYLRDVKAFRGAINTGWRPEAVVRFPKEGDVKRLSIHFPKGSDPEHYYPSVETDFTQLPGQVQEYLQKYCAFELKLLRQEACVSAMLRRAGNLCNTWGQLMRLWPELVAQFPEEMKRKYWKRKARASMPYDYYTWDEGKDGEEVRTGIDEKYTPEAFAEATDVILEAYMLPKPEGNQQRPEINWR